MLSSSRNVSVALASLGKLRTSSMSRNALDMKALCHGFESGALVKAKLYTECVGKLRAFASPTFGRSTCEQSNQVLSFSSLRAPRDWCRFMCQLAHQWLVCHVMAMPSLRAAVDEH